LARSLALVDQLLRGEPCPAVLGLLLWFHLEYRLFSFTHLSQLGLGRKL
jgi:hypothetical protein